MASSPGYSDRPPLQGFRRSFTVPHRQLSLHERAGLSDADAGTEILFTHPSVRIISFAPPRESIVSKSSETSADADYPIDTVETLPWRSRTEDLTASGRMIIEKVQGSVWFLKRGSQFCLPILRNTQCWCVDGESKFVWRKGRFQYYRLELPTTTDEEKDKAEELKLAFSKVLKFEKTPCPFKRGFHVDLPDDAITPRRKGKWTRKEGSQPNTPDSNSPLLRRTKGARSFSLHGQSPVPVPESRRQSDHGFEKRLYPTPPRRDTVSGLRPGTPSSEASSEDVANRDHQDYSDNGSSMDDQNSVDREDQHIEDQHTEDQHTEDQHTEDQHTEDQPHSIQAETEHLEIDEPNRREHPSAEDAHATADIEEHLDSYIDNNLVEDEVRPSSPIVERDGTKSPLDEAGLENMEAADVEVIPQDALEEGHSQDEFVRQAHPGKAPVAQALASEDTSTEPLVSQQLQPEVDDRVEGAERSDLAEEAHYEPDDATTVPSQDLAEEPVSPPEAHEASGREDEVPHHADTPELNQIQDPPMVESSSDSVLVDEPLDDTASVASTADSFHTVASVEQMPLPEEHEAARHPEPVEYLTTRFQHKRGVSEMTITASNFDSQNETAERPTTPRLIQSSASDESWPDVQTPSRFQDGLRQRLKSRRSASPLPSSSNVFAPSATNHGNHMTAVLLQKACNLALVKPIEVMVMVVHILARIAGGASLNDLLTGELFKRPAQHKRNSSFPDKISPQHDDDEDDFGVPIRGRTRSSETNGSHAADDTDADSMFDLD